MIPSVTEEAERIANMPGINLVDDIAAALTSYGNQRAAEAVAECVAAVNEVYRKDYHGDVQYLSSDMMKTLRLVAAKYEGGV